MVSDQSASRGAVSDGQEFQEALSFHQRGDLLQAERRYRAILATAPDHFDALTHLALLRLQTGNVDEAIGLFREALERNPNSAEARANLGNALLAGSRLEEAIVNYRAALDIDADNAEAHYGLATASQGLERFDDAIAAYHAALAVDPDYAEAAFGLGAALQQLKRNTEAIPHLQKALEIDPDFPGADHNLAAALQAQGQHYEAIRLYKKAIAADPGLTDTHNNLGVALMELGRLDEARSALEKAIALNPKRPGAYLNLFEVKKATPDDPHFLALQALAPEVPAMPPDWQLSFHFTMGKTLANIGENERSFRHYLAGNALKRREIEYDEAEALRRFRVTRVFFTSEFLQSWQGCGNPSSLPIFIVGMPRSGSTLIEQVLAAHPKVYAAGERLEWRDTLNAFFSGVELNMTYPERFLATSAEELTELGADYLQRLQAATIDGRDDAARVERITDKMPSNFALLGVIALTLPNARIIHTCRDPIDTCLSCFSTLFMADQPCSWDLGELGRYYRGYAQLMAHWRRALPPGMMLDVQYEDLVADFEPQARRIIAHCGLEWDDACLTPQKASRPVVTASSAQVRQPIYRTSVGRPRPSPEVLQPLLDGLGPDLAGDRAVGARTPP
jgi:tetratricopeptide (TPR) repeat protein